VCLSAKAKPSLQGWRISKDSVGFVTYLRSHRSGHEPLVEPSALEFAHSVLSYQAVTNFPEEISKWHSFRCASCWTTQPPTATAFRLSTSTTWSRCRPSWRPPRKSALPVILQASAGARKYAGEAFIKHLIQAAIEAYPHIPLVMHQDHGQSPEICQGAINLGFSSVMMDGSLMADGKTIASYDYNVEVTRKVVDMAHATGRDRGGRTGLPGHRWKP
jgi:hypothetical protein